MGEYLKHYGVKGMRWGKHLKSDKPTWLNKTRKDDGRGRKGLYIRTGKHPVTGAPTQEYIYVDGIRKSSGINYHGHFNKNGDVKLSPMDLFNYRNTLDYTPGGGYVRMPTPAEAFNTMFKAPGVRKALKMTSTKFLGTPFRRKRAAGVVKQALDKVGKNFLVNTRLEKIEKKK